MTEHSAVAVAPARLRLLGGWHLEVDGAEVSLGHREQRLLALLAVGAPGTRAQVASTLWPESTDEHALGNLRRAVWQCRRRCPGVLESGRSTLALADRIHVDVDDLRRAAGLTVLPMGDAHDLLAVLRGPELLPGWFDDWVVDERGRLEQQRVAALERIAEHAVERGDHALAVDAASLAAEIEPLRESAHEMAIRGLLGLGDVGRAQHAYRRYREVLYVELGVEPSARIKELVAERPGPAPAPVAVPRQRSAPPAGAARVAPPVPEASPGDWTLAEFLGESPARAAVRRAAAALVGVGAIALVVSVAIAVSGPDRSPGATREPGVPSAVPPSSTAATATSPPDREVRVRTLRSVAGSASFAVRATARPAQVRLVVRGPSGLRVVRHVVVRGPGGRQVVVTGLDPGTYQWSATSASADGVHGEVAVTPPPLTGPEVVAAQEPSPTPQPTPTATTSPTTSPTPTSPTTGPTTSPTPSHTPQPSSPASPTGTPRDPGTVAPTPVG